ncbi:unnamed protein product [Rotaria magnacalcarata]|uniref:Uncharacterized protein n=1 Tax=Rotaria magnacalcarata TaxID=392030 RepID=A0A814ZTW8_9BILA|nr:unnamed protein product [Rotaria magnacalcarata]
MCYKVQCRKCNHFTWAGCGMHKDSVLATIPLDQRCKCHLIKQSHQQPSSSLVDLIEDGMDTDFISLKYARGDWHPHAENEEDKGATQSLPGLANGVTLINKKIDKLKNTQSPAHNSFIFFSFLIIYRMLLLGRNLVGRDIDL